MPTRQLVIAPIPYAKGVSEAKKLIKSTSKNLWRLAEIISKLEPRYGDQTLKKFGEEVGLKEVTIRNYRRVYERFGNSQNARAQAFSTLANLAAVPNAEQIIAQNPRITEPQARAVAREARAVSPSPAPATRTQLRVVRSEQEQEEPRTDSPQVIWRRGLQNRAEMAAGHALYEDWSHFKIDRATLEKVRKTAQAWTELVEYLETLA